MTVTDGAAAPAEATAVTTGTPRLNAALAAAQAEMPLISKDSTGLIKGLTKDGRPFEYTYNYADLAAITAIAYPIIGKHGLSFSSQPTFTADGKFVLEYQLLHASGEEKGGTMPLPSSGKPQDLGTVLTYFRRYAFTAVTGIAPGGEDNDAATANREQRFDSRSRDPWEDATPAPPRQQHPADAGPAAAKPAGIRPESQGRPAAAAMPSEDADWIRQFSDKVNASATADEVNGLARQLGQALAKRTITPERATSLRAACEKRKRDLAGRPEMAGAQA